MLYFPFVFFLILLLVMVKRKGIGVAACMTAGFAISSFFSIILYLEDYPYALVDFGSIEVNVIPTLIYCLLVSSCIYPFYKYDYGAAIPIKPISNVKLLNNIVYLFTTVLILLILLFGRLFMFNLMFGDLGELRTTALEDAVSVTDQLSGISRMIASPVMILGHIAYFMIPLFFYSLSVNPERKWFNTLILITSMSPVFLGILNVDRSKTFYWVLLFSMCYFWFKKYLTNSDQTKYIKWMGYIVIGALVTYFVSVTISRFGERDYGSEGGLIIYAGQPFLNFVNLWDNYRNPDITLARVFPFYNYFFGGNTLVKDWNDYAFTKSGMHINIFYSYLGLFLVDLGRISVFLAAFLINRLATVVARRQVAKSYLTLSSSIYFFSVAIILQCGMISYFYSGIDRFLGLLFILFIAYILGKSND